MVVSADSAGREQGEAKLQDWMQGACPSSHNSNNISLSSHQEKEEGQPPPESQEAGEGEKEESSLAWKEGIPPTARPPHHINTSISEG